jgi:hypothetical protein
MNPDRLAEAVASAIDVATKPLHDRILALEKKPSLEYQGTWQRAGEYFVGNLVTDRGSLWICKANRVQSRPGDDSLSWTLCVKRGRDGRDGKDGQ